MDLFPNWTKSGSWTLGRDPLGIQATSVRLYRSLVPGLTNVTNRLRYYAFYCWVVRTYEQTKHSSDDAKWQVFIRRAEAIFALACYVDDAERSHGLAGGQWAAQHRQNLPADVVDVRPYTDRPGDRKADQYLLAKRGNFGQFYVASMTEVGLLAPSSRIPIVSETLGKDMAEAFAKSVGPAANSLLQAIERGSLEIDDLQAIGRAMHPARIPAASRELELLRNYLTAVEGAKEERARRASAWLLLDILHRGVDPQDEHAIRRAFYSRRLPDGVAYERVGRTIDRWRAFQANELCHIALEALLNGLVVDLASHAEGVEPQALVEAFLAPRLAALGASGQEWRDWALEVGVGRLDQEDALAKPILAALADTRMARDETAIAAALQLLAVLWARWSDGSGGVREIIAEAAGRTGRSMVGVITTLDAQAGAPAEAALAQALRRHVIADHLAIAGRKLASSGTFTYHFTLSDGLVSDGRLSTYGYTSPRLRNLIRFLEDADFWDGTLVTPAGKRFLDAHEPV